LRARREPKSNHPHSHEEKKIFPPKTNTESCMALFLIYMIINLLLFLTSCQQQHHHHHHRHFCVHSPSSFSVQGNFLTIFSSTLTSRRVCYNILFLGAIELECGKKKISSFTSYYYKVYDVRKLPNHIALDSTGVRTQRKFPIEEYFFERVWKKK
jgi:hypothetical protein